MKYIQNNTTSFILFSILGVILYYYYTMKCEPFTSLYTDLELNKLSKEDFLKQTGTEPSYFNLIHNILKFIKDVRRKYNIYIIIKIIL